MKGVHKRHNLQSMRLMRPLSVQAGSAYPTFAGQGGTGSTGTQQSNRLIGQHTVSAAARAGCALPAVHEPKQRVSVHH